MAKIIRKAVIAHEDKNMSVSSQTRGEMDVKRKILKLIAMAFGLYVVWFDDKDVAIKYSHGEYVITIKL